MSSCYSIYLTEKEHQLATYSAIYGCNADEMRKFVNREYLSVCIGNRQKLNIKAL